MFVQNFLNMECKNAVHLSGVSSLCHDNVVVFLSSEGHALSAE